MTEAKRPDETEVNVSAVCSSGIGNVLQGIFCHFQSYIVQMQQTPHPASALSDESRNEPVPVQMPEQACPQRSKKDKMHVTSEEIQI